MQQTAFLCLPLKQPAILLIIFKHVGTTPDVHFATVIVRVVIHNTMDCDIVFNIIFATVIGQ